MPFGAYWLWRRSSAEQIAPCSSALEMRFAEKYDPTRTQRNWNLSQADVNIHVIKDCHIWPLTGCDFSLPSAWRLFGNAFPVYLGRHTTGVTDGHLHHLSGPIVRTPYRTGPSARRVGALHPHCSHCWVGRGGVVSPHMALLSLRLDTQDLPQAAAPLNQPMEAFYSPSQVSKQKSI